MSSTETEIAAQPSVPADGADGLRADMRSRLKPEALQPGSELPDGIEFGRLQGTGNADGIIFLDGRSSIKIVSLNDGSKDVIQEIVKSKFRQALRYLKPHDANWLSEHPGQRGRCRPDVWKIRMRPQNRSMSEEIDAAAQAAGVSVDWTFRTTPFAIDLAQPEHIDRFWIVKAEEGIWCVFYK